MKVGVMASGRGSNFQAIIDAKARGEIPDVEISQLVVNKPEAYAIERAKKNNIPYEIIDSTIMTREEFDKETIRIFEKRKVQNIREMFPEILVPELPNDPTDYNTFLSKLHCFDVSIIALTI